MDNLTKFGRDKAGYTEKKVTNTQGDLYLDGVLFRANLPFPLIKTSLSINSEIAIIISLSWHGKFLTKTEAK